MTFRDHYGRELLQGTGRNAPYYFIAYLIAVITSQVVLKQVYVFDRQFKIVCEGFRQIFVYELRLGLSAVETARNYNTIRGDGSVT